MKLTIEAYFNLLKYYDFFDELFYYEDNTKAAIISKLGIKYSSYRVLKTRNQIDDNIITKLCSYFKINKIESTKQIEYEILILRIYYEGYYKQKNSLKVLLNKLEDYINENNYMKPILVLMKVYGYLNLEISIDEMQVLKPDLEYIAKFRKDYFMGCFKLIQQTILLFFDYKINEVKLKNIVLENENYSWFYYNLLGSYYYMKANDNKALSYYYEALLQYQKYHNEIREINTRSNIAYIHNILGNYSVSLRYTEQVLEYAYSSKNELYVSYLTQHYLFSKYMLDRNDEIKDFVDIISYDKKKLNIVSAIICILSLHEIAPIITNELINIFSYDKDIKIIEEYLYNNKNSINQITQTPYLVRLVQKAKESEHYPRIR